MAVYNSDRRDMTMPKEYIRLAYRFLKEVGLFTHWIGFINDPRSHIFWFEKYYTYKVIDVLGKTNFTDYLNEHGIKLPNNILTYELFGIWLKEHFENFSYLNTAPNIYLRIDKKRKKTKIRFEKS